MPNAPPVVVKMTLTPPGCSLSTLVGTLAENVALMGAEYGPPTPAIIMCPDCGSKIEAWPLEEGETRQIRCETCGITSTFALVAPPEPPAGHDSA